MSIYATLWALQFPRFGEFHIGCEWVTVIAQGVPAHVGAEALDPYASFLPTLPNSVAVDLRAVVFIVEGTAKGNALRPGIFGALVGALRCGVCVGPVFRSARSILRRPARRPATSTRGGCAI